jgi:hypothetical protein
VRISRIGLVGLLSVLLANFMPPALAACNIVGGKTYGECSGVTVNTGTEPSIVVTNYHTASGIIEGASVRRGGNLIVSGTSGPITIDNGGSLKVSGIVNGNVINNGGSVEVSGIINGRILMNGGRLNVSGVIGGVMGTGEIIYRSGAVIGGVPQE